MKKFLAIDLGATSGRTVIGTLDNGKISLKELTRFPNSMSEIDGHLYWDIHKLMEHVKDGLSAAKSEGVMSIGVDTWGVDFGCIADDGTLLALPVAYRDHTTHEAHTRYFKEVMNADSLYCINGIQHMGFNTLFQIYERRQWPEIQKMSKLLMMPDLITYLLTGEMVAETTIISTGGILDPHERELSAKLLSTIELNSDKFGKLIEPGEITGYLSKAICNDTGMECTPVVSVAGHDTASAVLAIPAKGSDWAYISSGTWSLIGIETHEPIINETTMRYNFTNECGVEGTTRLLKNITGMWVLEQCLQSWKRNGADYSYSQIVEMAESAPEFNFMIDTDDERFVCPADMPAAIRDYCIATGQTPTDDHGTIIRAILESLALKYRKTLDILRGIAGNPINRIHIIGGGSRNALLNQFAANATGAQVVAGPAECTAAGNIMMQAKAMGYVKDLAEIREITAASFETTTYSPADSTKWERQYLNYLRVCLNLTHKK